MKVVVLGNCQVHSINAIINSSAPFQSQCVLMHLTNSEQIRAIFPQLVHFDIIITQPLGEKYNELSTVNLKKIYSDKVVIIHNLYFDGLHPDYLPVQKAGLKYDETNFGGLSRMMLYAWFAGKSKDYCKQLFSLRWFEKVGFLSAWKESISELKRREGYIDVPFVKEVEEYSRERLTFFHNNNPTIFTLLQYTKKICNYIALEKKILPVEYYPDLMMRWEIWSVDPIVSNYHQLPYSGERFYNYNGGRFLTLEEMIDHEYALFEDNKDVISNTLNERNIDAILYHWNERNNSV